MKIKFHGARGSNPVSVTPARVEEISRFVWEFSRKNKSKTWKQAKAALEELPRSKYQVYGGATTCVEVKSEASPLPIFFDAGTGLTTAGSDRGSGLAHADFRAGKGKAAFFLTHTHWDHICGLTTLGAVFKPGNQFHFYGVHKDLQRRIAVLFQDEFFPVPFNAVERNFEFHQIPLNSSVRLGKLNITHFPQTHPGGSFAYRVDDGRKTFVFATDTSLKNTNKAGVIPGQNFYSNADVLVLDAQFSPEDIVGREDWGHAEIYSVVEFAVRENAKRLCLFHQSPTYNDDEIDRQLKRARQYLARKFGPRHPLSIRMVVEGEEIRV